MNKSCLLLILDSFRKKTVARAMDYKKLIAYQMKKNLFVSIVIALLFSSCISSSGVSIKVKETADIYSFSANFPPDRTHQALSRIDKYLAAENSRAFSSGPIDATITADNKTIFYMKSKPGDLELKLRKAVNTEANCIKFRQMCEEIKTAVK